MFGLERIKIGVVQGRGLKQVSESFMNEAGSLEGVRRLKKIALGSSSEEKCVQVGIEKTDLQSKLQAWGHVGVAMGQAPAIKPRQAPI